MKIPGLWICEIEAPNAAEILGRVDGPIKQLFLEEEGYNLRLTKVFENEIDKRVPKI